MKKELKIQVLSLIFIIVFSAFAYAEGTSASSSANTPETNAQRTAPAQAAAVLMCDSRTALKERIKCRLQNRIETNYQERLHESCRNLNTQSKENCRRLYQEIKSCYQETGTAKDRCFKIKTGFATSAVSGQGTNKEAARNYLVTLLYDLEERVEEKQEAGIITAEQASDLIAKIVEIKEKILQNENGSEIRPLIRELKQLWRQTFAPTQNPSNTTSNNTNST